MLFLRETARFSWIFCTGAVLYTLIEYLWRGYSHWTMTLCGGTCLCVMVLLCAVLRGHSLLLQCIVCALAITAIEFSVGCTVNLWLGMDVWDYSRIPYNLLGQICPRYTVLWSFLSFPVVLVCNKLPSHFFNSL